MNYHSQDFCSAERGKGAQTPPPRTAPPSPAQQQNHLLQLTAEPVNPAPPARASSARRPTKPAATLDLHFPHNREWELLESATGSFLLSTELRMGTFFT